MLLCIDHDMDTMHFIFACLLVSFYHYHCYASRMYTTEGMCRVHRVMTDYHNRVAKVMFLSLIFVLLSVCISVFVRISATLRKPDE